MPSNQKRDRKTGKEQDGRNCIQQFYIQILMIYMLAQLYKKQSELM